MRVDLIKPVSNVRPSVRPSVHNKSVAKSQLLVPYWANLFIFHAVHFGLLLSSPAFSNFTCSVSALCGPDIWSCIFWSCFSVVRDVSGWLVFAAMFLVDDCHAVYLWIGRRPTSSDSDDPESVVAGTANARFTAAKICAMQTALDYCNGMLPSFILSLDKW